MGAGQSKPVSGTSVTPILSKPQSVPQPVPQPVSPPVQVKPQPVPQPVQVKPQNKKNLTKITNAKKVEEATQKMLTVQSLIMTATVAGIAESIIKGTLATGGLIAVANPVVAPALVGVALIAAAYLRLKAGHLELITNLQLKSSKYIKLMNLVCISETVYQLMVNSDKNKEKRTALEKFDMNTESIKQYAELFRIQILLSAPNSLITELEKAKAISNSNYKALNKRSLLSKKTVGSFSSWFDRKSTFGNLYGDVTRVFQSKEMIASINRALDDLFLEIQIMLDRYDEFTRVYKKEYDNIVENFEQTPQFQLMITGSDAQASDALTPEEAAKHLEDAAKQLTAVGVKAQDPTESTVDVKSIVIKEVTQGEAASNDATKKVAINAGITSTVLEKSVNAAQNSKEQIETLATLVVEAEEAKTPVVLSPTTNNTSKPSVVTTVNIPIVNIPNKRNVPLKGNNPKPSNIPNKGQEHNGEDPVTYTPAPMVAAGAAGGSRKKKKRCRSKTVRRRKRRN
uniref:Uncharacterized protein n=1 Tax=viral metagenome TaxID=1070528 RepID=A0A6C0DG64_9ZZZZ